MSMHVDQEIFETIADLINETIKLVAISEYENEDNDLKFMIINEVVDNRKLSKSINLVDFLNTLIFVLFLKGKLKNWDKKKSCKS